MRLTSIPLPSSLNVTTISVPWRPMSRTICPVSGFLACKRCSRSSIPWSIALRSMCSNGATSLSRILRSNSPSVLLTTNSVGRFRVEAVWRTIRCRRGSKRENGTRRVRIRLSWISAWIRDCCNSRPSVSRIFSESVVLKSTKSEADSASDFDNWFNDEYWSISNGSKSA